MIDLATGTLYVVRWGYENGISGPTFRLFGLDMLEPEPRQVPFGTHRRLQRRRTPASTATCRCSAPVSRSLTKPSGAKAVVIAFGGGEGQGTAVGLGRRLRHGQARPRRRSAQRVVQQSEQRRGHRRRGGVWMANAAPAIDGNGDIYVVTGNGPYHPQFGLDQLGESVVRLIWNPGDPGSLTT